MKRRGWLARVGTERSNGVGSLSVETTANSTQVLPGQGSVPAGVKQRSPGDNPGTLWHPSKQKVPSSADRAVFLSCPLVVKSSRDAGRGTMGHSGLQDRILGDQREDGGAEKM